MEFHNAIKDDFITLESLKKFLIVLYPFAPHITEELNEKISNLASKQKSKTLQVETWPSFDEALTVEKEAEIVVQINGKVKGKIKVATVASEEQVIEEAKKLDFVKQALVGETIKRAIYVKGRLLNLVI
jgi:leucyl-tRNA synthetase